MLTHLHTAWDVDRAIASEERKLVMVRFGVTDSPECAAMDEILRKVEFSLSNYALIYVVDIREVPEFNSMYELYDPFAVMFFYRGRHKTVDFGTGNNNKINFPLTRAQDLIDIAETVYRAARKGQGQAVSVKNFGSRSKF